MARSRAPKPGGGAGKSRPPRKPRNFKAEYERRIKRGMALGKTRQAARGKPAKEHIIRKLPPAARKEVYASIKAAKKQAVDYERIKKEVEAMAAIKELYKRVKQLFAEKNEE